MQPSVRKSELYGIQILRAVAALAVICHHTLEESNGATGRFSPDWLTTSGASGVDIFFVISGFIMLHVSFWDGRAALTPGTFLFRRITRIYPFYWLCCLGMLSISAVGFLASHHFSTPTVVASLLLLPGAEIIGVAWTLTYEIYFYLIFAVMLWLSLERAVLIAVTASIAFLYFLSRFLPGSETTTFLANPLPFEFCLGLCLAYAYGSLARRGSRWPVALPFAALGIALLTVAPLYVAHPDTNGLPPLPRVAAWGIPATLIVASFLNVGAPRSAVARFWVLLGDASYALYLTHVFVMLGYAWLIKKIDAFSHLPQLWIVPIVVLFAVAVGIAAHLLLEKPILRLIRRVTHVQPGHASPEKAIN